MLGTGFNLQLMRDRELVDRGVIYRGSYVADWLDPNGLTRWGRRAAFASCATSVASAPESFGCDWSLRASASFTARKTGVRIRRRGAS
jgi:hypothetical protein